MARFGGVDSYLERAISLVPLLSCDLAHASESTAIDAKALDILPLAWA
jgi:hypothetical protein